MNTLYVVIHHDYSPASDWGPGHDNQDIRGIYTSRKMAEGRRQDLIQDPDIDEQDVRIKEVPLNTAVEE